MAEPLSQHPRITLDDTTYPPRYVAGGAIFDSLLDAICAVGTPVNIAETDIGYRLFNDRRPKPCVHFVGFKDDRYWSAVKVFGKPDVIHRIWDMRALREIWDEGDTVVFADPPNAPSRRSGDDITEWIPREQTHDDSAVFADPKVMLR